VISEVSALAKISGIDCRILQEFVWILCILYIHRNEKMLIAEMEHKTSMLGPAHIVIISEVENLMVEYLNNVRIRVCSLQYNARFLPEMNFVKSCSEKIAHV